MYGKIFTSIYDGTLGRNWEALVIMQQLIILANEDGVVDMHPEALSRRTGIPRDIIDKGLHLLGQPDPESRSPAEQGRRIMLLYPGERDWGWRLVNHAQYRALSRRIDKLQADRNRMREKRNNPKDVAGCRKTSQRVAYHKHYHKHNHKNPSTNVEGGMGGKGQFGNVFLSEEEMTKLVAKYPNVTERIEALSEYLAKIGPKKAAEYKSHYATILCWDRMHKDKNRKPEGWV